MGRLRFESCHTGSGGTHSPIDGLSGAIPLAVKQQWREDDLSFPCSVGVKKE
jgi:hypothetical protein